MLKSSFTSEVELTIYLSEQKIRKENKCLTVSERKQLQEMLDNPKKYIAIEKPKDPNIKPIVTNLKELKIPCEEVKEGEDISQIVLELKATLENSNGLGLSANQIGYQKRISYLRIPEYNKETKKMHLKEILLINPKIIEKDIPFKFKNEGCLSFAPNIRVNTRRYVYISVQNYNEKLEPYGFASQGLEAVAIEHELDHQNGLTLLDRKWTAK
jgi:peptide deformylase